MSSKYQQKEFCLKKANVFKRQQKCLQMSTRRVSSQTNNKLLQLLSHVCLKGRQLGECEIAKPHWIQALAHPPKSVTSTKKCGIILLQLIDYLKICQNIGNSWKNILKSVKILSIREKIPKSFKILTIRDKILQNLSKYWQSLSQRTPLCNSTARLKLFKWPSCPSIIRQARALPCKICNMGGNKSRKQENWFWGKWTNLGSDRAAAEQSESWNCSNVCQEMQFSSQLHHFLGITLDGVLK